MTNTLISVVMPVYNAEQFISAAIESILNQSYSNFEFIIVNDGSTDSSSDIIKEYAITDKRIIYINNEINIGNYACRNKGCKLAKGECITVMDSDDIAFKDRLEQQLLYLENNPQIVAVGSFFHFIDGGICVKPRSYDFIRLSLIYNNVFLHPSLIIRRDIMQKIEYYDESYRYSSDYDLVCKLALYGKIENVPQILMQYRLHEKQISSTQRFKQNDYANQIRLKYIKNLGFRLSESEESYFTLMMENSMLDKEHLPRIKLISDKLKNQNIESDIFDFNSFNKFLNLKLSDCFLRLEVK